MKKIFYILLFSSFTTSLFPQEVITTSVDWTKRHRVTSEIISSITPFFICGNENSFISFCKDPESSLLIKTNMITNDTQSLRIGVKNRVWKEIFYNKKNDKLYLLSSMQNINIFYSENNWKKKSDKAQPILYTIDVDGNGKYRELFIEAEDARKCFAPIMMNQWSDNRYLLGQVYFPKFGRAGTYLSWGITSSLK